MASKNTENTERSEHVSERRCLVRGEVGSKDLLIRFAVSPDGLVVPDLAEKLPGRGLWVTADAACLAEAIAKKSFGRAAKENVTVPANLLEQTRTLLRQRVADLLGLAKKAGRLLLGTEAVLQGLKNGEIIAIVAAADASASGLDDMHQRLGTRDIPVLQALTAAGIGAALGRDNTVYIGLTATKQGENLYRDTQRLIGMMKEVK